MKIQFQTTRAGRIDRIVFAKLPFLRHSVVQKLFRKDEIKLAGKAAKPDTPVPAGAQITIFLPDPMRYFGDLTGCPIIYQDAQIIALNKSAGLPVAGGTGIHGGTVLAAVQQLLDPAARLVHRLDRETSGVLVLARTAAMAERLKGEFRARRAHKTYWAVVDGRPPAESGVIDAPLGKHGAKVVIDPAGSPAETSYQVAQSLGQDKYLLRLEPRTGRTHQIRVHLASLGCPITGDKLYGQAGAHKRHLLHAGKLEVLDYLFEAPLSWDRDLASLAKPK